MPAAIAIPIIAGAAGSAISAKIQSHASNRAAALQSTATQNALDYTKQKDAQARADAIAAENANYAQYNRNQAILAPSQSARMGMAERVSSLLGLPSVNVPAPTPPPQYSTVGSGLLPTPTSSSTPASSASMVQLMAPTGQVKAVPSDQAQRYIQAGAKVVQ